MSKAPRGNRHYTDTHTHALDLLRDALGATVIDTYPNARAPLPDTGPCARCHHDPLRPGRLTPMRRLPTAPPRCAVDVPTH